MVDKLLMYTDQANVLSSWAQKLYRTKVAYLFSLKLHSNKHKQRLLEFSCLPECAVFNAPFPLVETTVAMLYMLCLINLSARGFKLEFPKTI